MSVYSSETHLYENPAGGEVNSQRHRRIIWHTPECRSAAARYAMEMISALTSLGVQVGLVCPANYQFRDNLERNAGVSLHFACSRAANPARSLGAKLVANAKFLLSSCWRLGRTVSAGDIVHFQHVFHFPFCLMFFLVARVRGCQIVFTVHDPVPHKWLLPAWLRSLERGALGCAYTLSTVLIVHSEPGKSTLLNQFGVDANKIHVIGRGPYGLGQGILPMPESDSLELLLFGSIRENKGIDLAIQAVQNLHRKGFRLRLTIAGDVLSVRENEFWERCQRSIAVYPSPIRVKKTFVPDERLPELFAECHCVLLPYTKDFSSDSGVAYMSIANGRPIIATPVGGLGPLLRAAPVGIRIEEATVEGITAALEEALRVGVLELRRLGREGAHYVNTECSWPKVAAKTAKVYTGLESYAGVPVTCALPSKD